MYMEYTTETSFKYNGERASRMIFFIGGWVDIYSKKFFSY